MFGTRQHPSRRGSLEAQAPRMAKADLCLTLLAGPCYLQRIKLQTTAPACRSWTRMPERCLVIAVRIPFLLFTRHIDAAATA
jgi:hypothetical protein